MLHILLVEDNTILAECTEINLVRNITGAQVVAVSSREGALRSIGEVTPDVAVVDCNLSDGEGLSLLPIILQKNPRCRVIVTSGMISAGLEASVFEMGGAGVLAKPYEMAELNAMVAAPAEERAVPSSPAPGHSRESSPIPQMNSDEKRAHKVLNKLSSVMTGLRLIQLEIDEELSGEADTKADILSHIEKMVGVITETSKYVKHQYGGDHD